MRKIEIHKTLEKDFQEAKAEGTTGTMLDYLKNILNYNENDARSIIIVHRDFLEKFDKTFAKQIFCTIFAEPNKVFDKSDKYYIPAGRSGVRMLREYFP